MERDSVAPWCHTYFGLQAAYALASATAVSLFMTAHCQLVLYVQVAASSRQPLRRLTQAHPNVAPATTVSSSAVGAKPSFG